MKISILMPVKNTAEFLPQCLESILGQSVEDWELIAVDDGSSDGSWEILEEWAGRDERVRVFRGDGGGIISALRMAFDKCSGELITRMDSDDICCERKLEVLKAGLMRGGPGHVALGLVEYFSDEGLRDGYKKYEAGLNGLTRLGANWDGIYKECSVPSPCWMVFREDLLRSGAFERDVYPEDYDLCFRFYEAGLKCLSCNEVLHLWRDHGGRTSRNDARYADNRFLDLKLDWFLRLDRDDERGLVLWGAGAKGKELARMLVDRGVEFRWVCGNERKVGKVVYGVEIEWWEEVFGFSDFRGVIGDVGVVESADGGEGRELVRSASFQVIVAVAGEGQEEVLKELDRGRGAGEMGGELFGQLEVFCFC